MGTAKKGCAIAALIFVAILCIGGFFAMKAATRFIDETKEFAKKAGSEGVILVVGSMLEEARLPQDKYEASMQPINEFAEQVKNGEVGLEQYQKVMEELLSSGVIFVAWVQGIESDKILSSSLSGEEKADAANTLRRFSHLVRKGDQDHLLQGKLEEIFYDKRIGEEGEEVKIRRVNISDDEIRKSLAIMKGAADEQNIAEDVSDIDLASELRGVIAQALASADSDS